MITLTSDFGRIDHRVPAIKGKIASYNPLEPVIDISHEIQAYNLKDTAYLIRNAYPHFPKGTVHIICVDSFYHKSRKNIVYKADDSYFIAADNGVLSLVFQDIKPEAMYEITLNSRFDDVVTFTPTDVFVPVAMHLSNGGLPEVIGRQIYSTKQLILPKPVFNETKKIITGEATYRDNFGNIVTNITKEYFDLCAKGSEQFSIKFRNYNFGKIYSSVTDLVQDWDREIEYHGHAAVIFNTEEFLELTIYKGSKHNGAQVLFGMKVGEKIFVEFY